MATTAMRCRPKWATPARGHRIGLNVNASRLDAQFDSSEFLPPTFRAGQHAGLPQQVGHRRVRARLIEHHQCQLDDDGPVAAQRRRPEGGGTLIDRFRTRRDQVTWQNALKSGRISN
jgi:hypothetical protein